MPACALFAGDHDDRRGLAVFVPRHARAAKCGEQAVQKCVLPNDRSARRFPRLAERLRGVLRRLLRALCLRLFFCGLRFRRFHFGRAGQTLGVQQTAHFVHAALRVARQLIEVADLPIQAALHVGIRFFDAVQKILGVFCGAAFRAAAHVQLSAGKQCVQNAVNIVFHLKSPFSG